jgi:ribonucleotide monophosphatase NagD (HAD superfamily)
MVLDAGPFVAALEYATGVTAEVVGKPSPAFFELACAELGLPASQVVCVGDSLENDCLGARQAGCRTILVRTGIFTQETLARSAVQPDLVIDSIAELARV